jgi:hypothetical protein
MAYSSLSWFNRDSMLVAGAERVIGQNGITPAAPDVVNSALLFSYAACMTPGGWLIGRKGRGCRWP